MAASACHRLHIGGSRDGPQTGYRGGGRRRCYRRHRAVASPHARERFVAAWWRRALLTPVTIAGLATALPRYRLDGDELAALLTALWPRLARRGRHLAADLRDDVRFVTRPITEFGAPLSPTEQSARYMVEAVALASGAGEAALADAGGSPDDIGLLVVASCTGYVLPGVDVALVPRLELREDVRRIPLAHLGCAGGAGALACASDWVRAHPGERALVVAVEVPSLTFRPADTSADNLLSALVFGDGAGAAVLQGGDEPGRIGIGRAASHLVPNSTAALGYELVDDGFRVIVSRRLPDILSAHLPAIVREFCTVPPDELDAIAVHPGGRAIVESVVRSLQLREEQVTATQTAMRSSGNTSSAALFFVLDELAHHLPAPSGRGLAIAFGPGLTVELLELTWRC